MKLLKNFKFSNMSETITRTAWLSNRFKNTFIAFIAVSKDFNAKENKISRILRQIYLKFCPLPHGKEIRSKNTFNNFIEERVKVKEKCQNYKIVSENQTGRKLLELQICFEAASKPRKEKIRKYILLIMTPFLKENCLVPTTSRT